MDLSQTKLTKMEWESIETPVTDQEKSILKLIQDGYQNVQIKTNDNESLLSFIKIEPTAEIHMYLYIKYFAPIIAEILASVETPANSSSGVKLGPKTDTTKPTKKSKKQLPTLQKHGWLKEFQPNLPNVVKCKPPKKIDLLRLQNMDTNITSGSFDKHKIVEFVQLEFCRKMMFGQPRGQGDENIHFHLYTLLQMESASISHINPHVKAFVQQMLAYTQTQGGEHIIRDTFMNAYSIIEKNPYILRFENNTLYDHQKKLFQLFRPPLDETTTTSKMVLYTAPTGTGKTMSPLGLSHGYRIIYICAARHVGMALAKSAISMEKRVAFAFGCETAADIRLHYYSAVEYTKNHKTGGIYKVDNSNGSRVEIMICDVYSYITAMLYMLSFNQESDIILYWDEPTISLDVPNHPLHEIIQKNWKENKISNIVLSCATLPCNEDIAECLVNYRSKFEHGEVHRVSSSDCKKTISLLNAQGHPTLPHLLFDSYENIQQCVIQCEKNPSLLRYLDLREIVRMIAQMSDGDFPDGHRIGEYFTNVKEITMYRCKLYYLDLLKYMDPKVYIKLHLSLKATILPMFPTNKITKHASMDVITKVTEKPISRTVSMPDHMHVETHILKDDSAKLGVRSNMDIPSCTRTPTSSLRMMPEKPSASASCFPAVTKTTSDASTTLPVSQIPVGVSLTTSDAHTLTDGPTIYLVEDVSRMGNYYAQYSHVPTQILDGIMEKIDLNNQIQKKMEQMMKSLDDIIGAEVEKERKMTNEVLKPEAKRLMNSIEAIRKEIQVLSIGNKYIPNTLAHQQIWVSPNEPVTNAFVPYIDDDSVRKIMELGIDSKLKLLLLMGIGVFDSMLVQSQNPAISSYMEIMKRMTYKQQLILIIASSDYIYGTNYQLCHGFLGKDLHNMTQQKIIQAMGRIGRNNIQQEYTVRFRDDSLLYRVFLPLVEGDMEASNMCKLFQ
uniref:Uncharacterized protein n=1 Tax=viral metagenome TaxID=1070528 RepID=A0A6C0HTY9_9ZZZZ